QVVGGAVDDHVGAQLAQHGPQRLGARQVGALASQGDDLARQARAEVAAELAGTADHRVPHSATSRRGGGVRRDDSCYANPPPQGAPPWTTRTRRCLDSASPLAWCCCPVWCWPPRRGRPMSPVIATASTARESYGTSTASPCCCCGARPSRWGSRRPS